MWHNNRSGKVIRSWIYLVFHKCFLKLVLQRLKVQHPVDVFSSSRAVEHFSLSLLLMFYEEGNGFKMFVRPQGCRRRALLATLNINFICLEENSTGHV